MNGMTVVPAKYYSLIFRELSPQSAQRTQRKIENEKSLSIFKKILCLVFPWSFSVHSVFSIVKILAGTADGMNLIDEMGLID